MTPAIVRNPAERAKVHHVQTAISTAAAEGNTARVKELMRELARLTSSQLPESYRRSQQ